MLLKALTHLPCESEMANIHLLVIFFPLLRSLLSNNFAWLVKSILKGNPFLKKILQLLMKLDAFRVECEIMPLTGTGTEKFSLLNLYRDTLLE